MITKEAIVDLKKCALIIFVRHPELGKVKTRLAKGIGDEKALAVYKLLLQHTFQITSPLTCEKFIFYTDGIIPQDLWDNTIYQKRTQSGSDLGVRMHNAFGELFDEGFEKVLIIGSDCYQLSEAEITQAFGILNDHDVVMGPTFDGGYYLLGMTKLIPGLFKNKSWSTEVVASQTLQDVNELGLSSRLLAKLHDVDEPEDLMVNGINV